VKKPEQVSINPDRNSVFVPGSGNMPIVGLNRETLDARSKIALKEKVMLERIMRSTWQCVECKQKFPGTEVRMKKGKAIPIEYVCPECGGPVVVKDDALQLSGPLAGPQGTRR
jgi:RNase P subunit RPR2